MKNLYWGIALVAFGGILLLDNLGYANFDDIVGTFWPVALILFGLNIVMKHRAAPAMAPAPAGSASAADLFHASNVFGDVVAASSSESFKGGSVSTLMGDARIDLSGVKVAAGRHELRIHSVFGSSTILLPKGAPYAVEATTTFGSMTVLGETKGGFATRSRVESPSFAGAEGTLTVYISHVFGATRVEEVSPIS